MNNSEIEKKLEKETSNITPYVYDKVLKRLPTRESLNDTPKKFSIGLFRKIAMACFCSIFLIMALTISSISLASYESYTIDVNPSIELTTNRFNKVIKVNYNNEDAYNIFSDVKLVSKKLDEAINICVEVLDNKGYFNNEENIVVLSLENKHTSNNDSKMNIISNQLKGMCEAKGKKLIVITHNVSKDDKEIAKNYDISIGKLKMINEILELDHSYTFEELKNFQMKDLKNIYIELTNKK